MFRQIYIPDSFSDPDCVTYQVQHHVGAPWLIDVACISHKLLSLSRGGAVERSCQVRVGDELVEVAADRVAHMSPEILQGAAPAARIVHIFQIFAEDSRFSIVTPLKWPSKTEWCECLP